MDNALTVPADLQAQLAALTGCPSPQQYAVNKAVERAALRARFSGQPVVKPTVYVRATEREVVEAPSDRYAQMLANRRAVRADALRVARAPVAVDRPRAKRAPASGFCCQECGHGFRSVKAAERAYFGAGCPKCGGADIGEVSR